MTTKLQLLREFPAEEPGAQIGFKDNLSGSSKYITDGHVLLVKSAIVSGGASSIREAISCVARIEEKRITGMLDPLMAQSFVQAWYIGYATVRRRWPESVIDTGIIRDATGRMLVIDTNLLWFAIHHTHLDTLWMVSGGGTKYSENPLVFKRGGEFVGCMMALRLDLYDFRDYDTSGEPVALEVK